MMHPIILYNHAKNEKNVIAVSKKSKKKNISKHLTDYNLGVKLFFRKITERVLRSCGPLPSCKNQENPLSGYSEKLVTN